MEIGSQSYFAYLTAATYWSLILCWSIILGFYVREYRRLRGLSPMIATLLVVIFIDGARTLVESVYFGTAYTARTQLLPPHLWPLLMEGDYVILPKALNLIGALVIMAVMVRHWFADLEAELQRKRAVDQLYTELQQAYADLQQSQKARDDMIHMLVHDMRTPLTNVITSLYTLQQVGDQELTEEMVGAALRGSQRVLGMVNDLLDISRMETGEVAPDWRDLPMRGAVEEALAEVRALAERKSIAVAEAVPAGLTARADPELVRRVLVNILGNAIRFTPPGGRITVEAAQEGESIRCSITDTGPGISPADRERIFDKFYQAGRGGSGNAGATVSSSGLGLTFCKLAVRAQGGEIGVESELGEGSTFWFTLPAATPRLPSAAAAVEAVHSRQ